MADDWVFPAEVGTFTAQIAAVLIVAYIVELRATAARRAVDSATIRVLLLIPFFALVVLAAIGVLASAVGDVHGEGAKWLWSTSLSSLVVLLVYVAVCAWAAISVATQDAEAAEQRREEDVARLREPGWKWFVRGHRL